MLDDAIIERPTSRASLVEALVSLATLSRALRMHWLTDLDVEVGQDMMLSRMSMRETVSVSDLAHSLMIRPSSVSKMLDRMTERGWCERLGSTDDKRRTLVRLTRAGGEKQVRIGQLFAEVEASLLKALRHESSDQLMPHLEETRRALQLCVDRVR